MRSSYWLFHFSCAFERSESSFMETSVSSVDGRHQWPAKMTHNRDHAFSRDFDFHLSAFNTFLIMIIAFIQLDHLLSYKDDIVCLVLVLNIFFRSFCALSRSGKSSSKSKGYSLKECRSFLLIITNFYLAQLLSTTTYVFNTALKVARTRLSKTAYLWIRGLTSRSQFSQVQLFTTTRNIVNSKAFHWKWRYTPLCHFNVECFESNKS